MDIKVDQEQNLPARAMTFALPEGIAASGAALAGMSPAQARPDRHKPVLRHLLIILIFTGCIGLAGIFQLPVLDRDEARFVQATTQMLETKNFISINYQDTERNKKPVGIHWLQAAAVKIIGQPGARDIWVYRIPSYLAGLIAVVLIYLVGCRLFGEMASYPGTILLASAPVFAAETTIAKTDATLLACICAAQLGLYIICQRVLSRQSPNVAVAVLFWVAIGCGTLIKGPIGPMVSLATLLVVWGWLLLDPLQQPQGNRATGLINWRWRVLVDFVRHLNPLMGVLILVVMIVPWAYAIGMATQGRFFTDAIGGDMLGKVGTVQEHHAGPFGYHFMVLWVMFWPAALFLPLAFRTVLHNWRHPGVAFCIAWIVPSWLLFEAASTKLPHYTLPLYPAIALLVGATVTQARHTNAMQAWPLARYIGVVLYGLGAMLVAAIIYYLRREHDNGGVVYTDYIAVLGVFAIAFISIYFFLRQRFMPALVMNSLGGLVVAWFLYAALLPTLTDFQVTQKISEKLDMVDLHPLNDSAPAVALVGYNEPSAVFMLGTQTRISNPTTAVDWLKQKTGHVAVVESRLEAEFLEKIGNMPVINLGQVAGFNYSNGKRVVIQLYQSTE